MGMATAASYSQTVKLNVQIENGTVLQLIKTIEKQSEFTFVYNVNELNVREKLSVNLKNKHPKFSDPKERGKFEHLPEGINYETYFAMTNVDPPMHYFKYELVIPWVKGLLTGK